MRRYSVAALGRELEQLLASRYPAVEVEGEIAQLQSAASGHCYLVLRDAGTDRRATLQAVVWRSTWRGLRFQPRQGDRVICRGRLGAYAERGIFQLYVNHVEPAGKGDLAEKIAKRIARLQAEGLLDPARKRPLPAFPRTVGLVTSPAGAALHDFLVVSRERWPAARVLLSPCYVQGEQAASSVVRAVDLLLQDGRAEMIVVTRGGGSKEDLLPFQDEQLARFLARCPVPVVSAVGHEVDTTIADLVADAVAPTPSAAAMLLPDRAAWAQRLDGRRLALDEALARLLRRRADQLAHLSSRLRHPGDRLREVRRRAGELEERLRICMRRTLQHDARDVARLEARLAPAARAVLLDRRRRTERAEERLPERAHKLLAARRHRLAVLAGRLDALSPLAVLGRGYAIVKGTAGVVTDPAQVRPGDPLEVRVQGGTFPVKAS